MSDVSKVTMPNADTYDIKDAYARELLENKVDKVAGKGLSTNDYTTPEKNKLFNIAADATKTESSTTNGNIVINNAETKVYDDSEMQGDLSTAVVETEDGNPISFTTRSAQNSPSAIVTFEPVQDSHGYDRPWPEGGGKNLLENRVQDGYASGITVTRNADGSLTLNGTASGDRVVIGNIATGFYGTGSAQNDGKKHIPNGNYIGSTGFSSPTVKIQIHGTNASSGIEDLHSISSVEEQTNFTIDDTYAYNYVRLFVKAGTYKNVTIYPMIRLATETDETYEPYANICPITGRTEVNVDGFGKNLLPLPSFYWITRNGVTITVDESGVFTLNGDCTGSFTQTWDVTLYPGTYKISGAYGNSDFYNSVQMSHNNRFCISVDNQNLWDNIDGGRLFTISKKTTCRVLMAIISTETTGITFSDSKIYPMIRLATETDATFEPYATSNDLTISLGQEIYGGALDVVSGELTVTMGIVDLGSATYTYESTKHYFTGTPPTNVKKPSSADALPNAISDVYNTASGRDVYYNTAPNGSIAISYTTGAIWIYDTRYEDATALKTDLSGHVLCYELATPITYQLTPNQIKLLSGANSIWTDGTSIKVSYRDGKVATLGDLPDMESYYTKSEIDALITGAINADY